MSKRDRLYSELSAPDGVPWPADDRARAEAVRDLFGAQVIGAMDSVLSDSSVLVAGRLTEAGQHSIPGEELRDRQERLVAQFRTLTDAQRAAVNELLRYTCSGFLYWLLVKIDQFPGAAVEISARLHRQDADLGVVVINNEELRYLYFDWIDKFSDEVARS